MRLLVQRLGAMVPIQLRAALSEDAIAAVLYAIADSARDRWQALAGERLRTTALAYRAGLTAIEVSPRMVTIALEGVLPHIVEDGMSTTDLRSTLLGPNVPEAPPGQKGKRRAKDGHYYRSIPFRHAAATSGYAAGMPMGAAYAGSKGEEAAGALGRSVYRQAKKLGATTGMPYGETKWGDRLPAGLAPLLKPHHTTDIYAGMVRMEKTYERATQSEYMTFRTISEKSDPAKWIRPATQGLHLAERVHEHIARIAPAMVQSYLAGLGG